MDQLILIRRPDIVFIKKKKKTYRFVNFAVLVDHRVKFSESEKIENYLDLARVNVIPKVVGVLGTVSKSFEKGLDE